MPVIAFASAAGSRGATTTALATLLAWPDHLLGPRPVLVEADPGGGSLALAHRLPDSPGLLSLVAEAASVQLRPTTVARHAQYLNGLQVVVSPLDWNQVETAWESLNPRWQQGDWDTGTVVLDAGRLGGSSQGGTPVSSADVLVLVVAGDAPALALAAQAAARTMDAPHRNVVAAVVGPCPYSTREIAEVMGFADCVQVPWDPAAAAPLLAQAGPRQQRLRLPGRRQSPLLASASQLALRLKPWLRVPEERPAPSVHTASGLEAAIGRLGFGAPTVPTRPAAPATPAEPTPAAEGIWGGAR